jgi:hypothetical protein
MRGYGNEAARAASSAVTTHDDDGPVITWSPYGIDGGCIGVDQGGYLVAQVVWYDAPEPGWAAFVRHQRLDGHWAAPTGAVAASEAVLEVRSGRCACEPLGTIPDQRHLKDRNCI